MPVPVWFRRLVTRWFPARPAPARKSRLPQLERLEDRVCLAVDWPSQLLPAGTTPIEVLVRPLSATPTDDLLVVDTQGQLTIARGGASA
jgi:hypothetical protein